MKLFFLLSLSFLFLFSQSFQEYKNSQKKEFSTYETEFQKYKKAYQNSFTEYKNEIEKKWPSKELSNKHKFVQYNKDYKTKTTINYEKGTINLSVIAKNEQEARKEITKSLNNILNEDVKSAYNNDQLEQKIAKELNKPINNSSDEKLISDVLNPQIISKYKKEVKRKELKKVSYKNSKIFTLNLKIPSNAILNKAKKYRKVIKQNSNKQKIPEALIYSIIHSESSYNPMARSHIPAFGLMQIVPHTAGIDSYNHLYGKKRTPSSSFLYKSSNNINFGSAYLHILYFKYLRKIKDPQSRLYCTMAAYNTGAGNIAKTFTGNTNINKAAKKINTLSSQEVLKKLFRSLPYSETRVYLKKVNDRFAVYSNLLSKDRL